jgi:fibronectin-binding autotransporter adhesin
MKIMQPKPHSTSWSRVLAAVSTGLALAGGISTASAADKTWTGAGDAYSWSDGANWGGSAPVANDHLFFDGNAGTNNNNDILADTDFSGITFNAGAGLFTITGNEVDLLGGVTNLSANPQTLSLNMEQTGNRTHYTLANMTYDGVMRNNALIKRGPATITLAGGAGNSSLRAEIYDGALVLAKTVSSALGSSPIVASDTGILRIAGPATDQIHFNQRVVVTNGGVLQIQNTFEEIGALSGSNSLTGVIENGLAGTTNRLDIGGGSGHEGIYSGLIRNGAAGVLNLRVYRHDNKYAFNGTHTYTGTTEINNTSGTGITRMIMNGTHAGGGDYIINGHASTTDRKAGLCGSGFISAASTEARIRGLISPGGSLSADLSDLAAFTDTTAVLTISNNVTITNGTLDIQVNGTTAGTSHDQLAVAGAGVLTLTNADLQLLIAYAPSVGDKLTIVKVQGTAAANTTGQFASLNGVATDLSQGAKFIEPLSGQTFQISYRAEGTSFDAGVNGNDVMLQVVPPLYNQKLTWRGNGTDNNWDSITTANWWNGTNLVTFTNSDFVSFDNSGTNNTPINLVGDLTPNFMTVDATKDYVLAGSGKLTGAISITKTNTGTLSLVTDNDASGSMAIRAGTVQVGTNGTSGAIGGTITVSPNGIFAVNRSDDTTFANTTFSGPGAFVHKGDGQLTVTADIPFTGRATNSGGLLQLGDGTSLLGSLAGDVNVPSGKQLTYKYSNGQKDVYNSLSGSGTVVYDSSLGGTIKIATTPVSSNFTGVANLITGTRLWCSDFNAGYNLGNGNTMNVPDSCQIWIDRSATPYNQVFNITGNGYAGDSPMLGALRLFGSTLNGEINLLADARIGGTISSATILAPVKGSFRLEVLGNADYQLNMGPTNGTHTYASTLVTRGWIVALNSSAISTGPLSLDIAGGLRLNGNNLAVASLTDITGIEGVTGSGAQVQNNHGSTAATLTVGSDNSDFAYGTYGGVFGNGGSAPLNVTKIGAGIFTVSGINTNTGVVTVNGGTLALSGSGSFANASKIIANASLDLAGIGGTLTLTSGQTLGGSGTVAGAVDAPAGSTVAPGASVGTLTVSGNVTLNGNLHMELNRTNAPFNCDRLVSSGGTITYGGSLQVTNIGPALQVNDTFQLFPSGVAGFGGNITLATTDATGATYTWQNNIATLGSVKVLTVSGAVNPVPTNIVATVSGGNLNLSWPADRKGWSLQAQTNALSVGLKTNWVTLGYESTNAVSIPINAANPAVFYRLFYVAP